MSIYICSLRKKKLNTSDVAALLKKVFKVSDSAIGYAGMKDKQGVTRQWFSVADVKWNENTAANLSPIKVIRHSYHTNKLRLSHLKGNKFQIVLRGDIEQDSEKLENIRKIVAENGVPNFFGTQRFGYQGKNIATGYSLFKEDHLKSKIRSKRKRSLFISSLQSLLFNEYLMRRINLSDIHRPIKGERWTLGGSKTFLVSSIDELKSEDAVASGPMFGKKYLRAEDEALRLENEVLNDYSLCDEDLARNGKLSLGTRRALWIKIPDLKAYFERDTIVLEFELPSGSYALNVVACFCKKKSLA